MHPDSRDLIDAREAAALLHISRATLERWERTEILVPAKLGTKRYYSKTAILAAITPPPATELALRLQQQRRTRARA